MPQIIDSAGAIIKVPFDHTKDERIYNKRGMYFDHPHDDIDAFIDSVKEAAPEYWATFNELLNDHYQYPCNIFAMKKEHFLEMCEMCFRVLDHFDKKQGYRNNEDVIKKMENNEYSNKMPYGFDWQIRLQGFLLEWLTELYYRNKFGIENCYKSEAGTFENNKPGERKFIYFGEGYTTKA